MNRLSNIPPGTRTYYDALHTMTADDLIAAWQESPRLMYIKAWRKVTSKNVLGYALIEKDNPTTFATGIFAFDGLTQEISP